MGGTVEEVRLLQVRGHQAVFIKGYLTWDEAPGVQVTLSGNADLPTLVRIAESLAPVPVNDPRIKNP